MSAGEDTATRDTATRNLELVKRAYASWQNGDLDAFVADYTEDVEVRPYLGALARREHLPRPHRLAAVVHGRQR